MTGHLPTIRYYLHIHNSSSQVMIIFKLIAYEGDMYETYLFFVSLFSLQLIRPVCPTLIKAILQIIF